MTASDHVAFVLQVIIAISPLAVYFLSLGLVNSQPHPHVVESRSDFIVLTLAFVPMIAVPLVTLVAGGLAWAAPVVVVLAVVVFMMLLPKRQSGWVVYNTSERQCCALLGRACRSLGWSLVEECDGVFRILPAPGESRRWLVRFQAVPWLRNVTLEVSFARCDAEARRALGHAMRREVGGESLLPSASGLAFVLLGTGLMGVPMACLLQHMDAVVEVVRELIQVG